jgi:hypothetical protein
MNDPNGVEMIMEQLDKMHSNQLFAFILIVVLIGVLSLSITTKK